MHASAKKALWTSSKTVDHVTRCEVFDPAKFRFFFALNDLDTKLSIFPLHWFNAGDALQSSDEPTFPLSSDPLFHQLCGVVY